MRNQEFRQCQFCKNEFLIESEDFMFYEKIQVPPPTFCPECRSTQRLLTRNIKSLYKRNCDQCGNNIVSRFATDNPAKMYCRECWWADGWGGLDYGRDYDFSRSFFEQFKELLFSVPHVALFATNVVNSDYVNMESDIKNCYLTFGGHYNEDCMFSEYSIYSKNVYDSYWSMHCEDCLGNINLEKCYRTFFSRNCNNCLDTFFSYDCRGCSNIIGCAGLRNKNNCIYNKQYSKEEFEKLKTEMDFGSNSEIKKIQTEAEKVWQSFPKRFSTQSQTVNCTGDNISNAKNTKNAFWVEEGENLKYVFVDGWSKDCQDETSVGKNELSYMSASGGGYYNCKAVLYSFSADVLNTKNCYNCEYSYTLINSSDCFGCVGIRNKQYCILNKQYTKEDYLDIKKRIIVQMGERPFVSSVTGCKFGYGDFFPPEHSLFAYNETVANDFYPLDRDQILSNGFLFKEDTTKEHEPTDYNVPDNIKDVKDDILEQVLKCELSNKTYRITKKELQFYRKVGLPIPRVAPFERIRQRFMDLLPIKLWERQCMCSNSKHNHQGKCPTIFETPYSPGRPEVVYCEDCYQREVY
ncbi:MAG: hypothetical protein K9L98_00575 [Candidatus Pacebacteria bacterium]|nr:hypothetical protein [Candidatus Paceibacterota bacterium]MCF7862493.1 hypothetical protein [Candidatus Paceibacterota bacterium]